MNDSLSELKIKNIESVTIYDTDGNELIKLEPVSQNSIESNRITLTFDDAIEGLEKSQEQIAKALKEIVWRTKKGENKNDNSKM